MTPEENVLAWEKIVARARQGAGPMAEAMARYIAERAADDTLQRSAHGVGEYWKAAPGAPPASASGNLASRMYSTRAQGNATRATAFAGNNARQAKMLEFGCEPVMPSRGMYMHWVDSGGSWYHKVLPIGGGGMPAHPFLQPTVDEAIEDGSLRQVAIEAFKPYDP